MTDDVDEGKNVAPSLWAGTAHKCCLNEPILYASSSEI
jgi:hypothetical protein